MKQCGIKRATTLEMLVNQDSQFVSLERLLLDGNEFGSEGVATIGRSLGIQKLKELSLRQCNINQAYALEELLSTRLIESLEKIDLSSNPIGDDGMMAFAKSPFLKNIRLIKACNCHIRYRLEIRKSIENSLPYCYIEYGTGP